MSEQNTPKEPKGKMAIIHIAVTEEERQKAARYALAEHRTLSNWGRLQLLKAFDPKVDAAGPTLSDVIANGKLGGL